MVGSSIQNQIEAAIANEAGAPDPAPSMPVRRVKRPDPPNKAALVDQISSHQKQIEDLQSRIAEIKAMLDSRAQSRHVASPEVTALRNRLSELNAQFRAAVDSKRRNREELEMIKEKLRSDSRSSMPDVKADQIDEEIRKLEYRQTHTSLRIDEEKRLVQQIERLRKSRETLIVHESRLEEDQATRSRLVEAIKDADKLIDSIKAQQDEQRRMLSEIREKEASQALDVPALLQEKNSAYETIKSLRDEISHLRSEFNAKNEEYWKKEREWRAQQAMDKKLKVEKIKAEKMEREKIRKQREAENFVEPYTYEILSCEQLISYMQKIVPETETVAPQLQKAEIVASAGLGDVIISKKNRNEDELEGWFAGYGGGKKGKKNKGSDASAAKNKLKEKISLSLDAITSFGKLKVSPPTVLSDVPKAIEDLQKKKEQFVELQKKKKELRERGEDGIVDVESNNGPPTKERARDVAVDDALVNFDSTTTNTDEWPALDQLRISETGKEKIQDESDVVDVSDNDKSATVLEPVGQGGTIEVQVDVNGNVEVCNQTPDNGDETQATENGGDVHVKAVGEALKPQENREDSDHQENGNDEIIASSDNVALDKETIEQTEECKISSSAESCETIEDSCKTIEECKKSSDEEKSVAAEVTENHQESNVVV